MMPRALTTFLMALLLAHPLWAAGDKGNPENPLNIVADIMECDQKTNICTATGSTFAQKLKDPAKQTIRAEKLIAHFEKKNNGEAKPDTTNKDEEPSQEKNELSKLKKLEAIGDVVMTDDGSILRCHHAIYHADSETAEFFGNVSLTRGRNQMEGDYGHADLKTSQYFVKADDDKEELAQGLFYQNDDTFKRKEK